MVLDTKIDGFLATTHLWAGEAVYHREPLQLVTSFGQGGHVPGTFYGPHNVAVDSKGNIYTTETWGGKRVQKFVYKGVGPSPGPTMSVR